MRFDGVAALDGFTLDVPPGSVTAVIGPSGCGKSTLLRVVAGLQQPDDGTIAWDGRDVTATAPHRRGFGLMFQDYALFPHRSVAANVGFGLRMAGMSDDAHRARVREMLDLVGLGGFGDRSIDGLSGGEQQRVALARTLAPAPELLMLDEPVGSLDRTLRERLLAEMREIFAGLGITVLYVTHDQDEAFALADRIAVMRTGRLVTVGTPDVLWADPGSVFVARFIGHENILTGAELGRALGYGATEAGAYLIPGDAVGIEPSGAGTGTVLSTALRTGRRRTEVDIAGVVLAVDGPTDARTGDRVAVSVPADAVVALRD